MLTYIVFDHFPTEEAIAHPDNAAFSEPAAWYLGEIVRRSEEEFPRWIQRFGSDVQWDFSVERLDALEALIRQVAGGPEELLEDKANADFLEGASRYFGEVLRRSDPDGTCWDYERRCHPEPELAGWPSTYTAEHLATVYTKNDGVLRGHYDWRRRLKERRALENSTAEPPGSADK
jgi:hypothetical protein